MKLKKITTCLLAGAMAISVTLSGCGSSINPDAVGATLNGEDISLGFMNFLARYQQAVGDASYLAYFGAEMWTTEISEGVTMEDSTKDSVLEMIETTYLLEDHMADYGVELTEEELTSIENAAKQFMSDNSAKAIKQMGATEEYVKEMLRLYTIQNKMRTAIYDDTEVAVSDEEVAQRVFSYFRASTISTTDEDGNKVDYTSEEMEEFAKEMEKIAADAKEDFEGVAEEKGYTISTYTYGADDTGMDVSVIEAADALKEGEVSNLISTKDYFYVLRLDSEFDEEKTEEKRKSVIEQKKAEEYTAICDGYKEAATFDVNEEAWATVKFDRLFGLAASEEDAAQK